MSEITKKIIDGLQNPTWIHPLHMSEEAIRKSEREAIATEVEGYYEDVTNEEMLLIKKIAQKIRGGEMSENNNYVKICKACGGSCESLDRAQCSILKSVDDIVNIERSCEREKIATGVEGMQAPFPPEEQHDDRWVQYCQIFEDSRNIIAQKIRGGSQALKGEEGE